MKKWFLRNSDWLILVVGFITIIVEVLEFLFTNPEEYTVTELTKQIPFGLFMFTLLFYIIRLFKGAERRV